MTSSEKQKYNIFNKQFKNTEKSTFKDGKHFSNFHNMHECRKLKRLKSHRERNRIRGCGKKAPKFCSPHRQCRHRSSKDMAYFHSCCHHSSRRNAPSSCTAAVTKEPSVITESRLIGHQGLFNHEVKSIDIERLLSEQRKMERSKLAESTAPHWSSASRGSMAGDTEKLVLFEHKDVGASKSHDELCDKEKGKSQRLAPTLEDRPHQVPPEPSSESCKSPSSANHSDQVKVRRVKLRQAQHLTSVKDRETQLLSTAQRQETKTSDRNANETVSSEECTPKNQECAGLHSQTYSLSPVRPPSSRSAENVDLHHTSGEPGCSVAPSVGTLAAALCHRLKFPFLKQRSLVEESRQVLLNALQERDGPQVQENLLQGWTCYSFDSSGEKAALHQEEATADQDEAKGPKEVFASLIPESPPCFESPANATLKTRRSRHFSWKSSPHLACNTNQVRPVETFGFLDNIFSCTHSPELCMNFEPFGSPAREHLFTQSPASSWREKPPASPHWGDTFNWPRSRENIRFDSLSQTRIFGESRSSRSHYSKSPFFLDQPGPQPVHRPANCLQDQVPFDIETYSLVANSAQFKHQQQERHFQAFHQTLPPLSCFPHTSRLTDMDIYPPSCVLDKEAPPYSTSLEPWSFPPMRLY
ncbi:proline-rich protein 19 isoform X2 [Takifugu rubripes]|nr:uncharacterized protein LOC105416738 isoform X2 [Takifugu rubripes]